MHEILAEKGLISGQWWRVAVFFASVLVSLIAGKLARFIMEKSAKRSGESGRKWVGVILKCLSKPAIFVSFTAGWWLGASILSELNRELAGILDTVLKVLTASAFGYAFYSLVDVIDYYLSGLAKRTNSKVDDVLAPLVGKSIRITIFVIVTLNVVQVISGKNITTILASLGVGGLAIALAGQDTIKNFFGSLVILADKPFEIGDRIIVDSHDGPVENVGFRSTKIRTLEGHLVTVPNSEMVNRTVQNIGKRPYIRRLAQITITYDTPIEKVDRAVEILKEILEGHEGMDPDLPPRVYFNEFNDCSLNIIMIYWYHPPDYWKYMEFSERVNMQILKRFNAEGIDFAFPTQTLYLANDEKRQLALKMLDSNVA